MCFVPVHKESRSLACVGGGARAIALGLLVALLQLGTAAKLRAQARADTMRIPDQVFGAADFAGARALDSLLEKRCTFAPYVNGKNEASEMRFFLTANESQLTREHGGYVLRHDDYSPDLRHRWDSVVGDPLNNEWNIRCDQGSVGDYVLRDLQSSDYWISANSDTVYCSFIYRLDDRLNTGSRPLFAVEYRTIFLNDSTKVRDTALAAVSYITCAGYSSYAHSSHPLENPRILSFPDLRYRGTGFSKAFPHNYAVLSTAVPTQSSPRHRLLYMDCSVKRLVPVDLVVRGLRIRTQLAEKVLTNDSATVAEIVRLTRAVKSYVIDTLNGGSTKQWNSIPYLTSANEEIGNYHVLARVDQLLFEAIGKHIMPRIVNSGSTRYSWYRSAYEDETGNVLPPSGAEHLQYLENYISGGAAGDHKTPFSFDGADSPQRK